MGLYLFCTWQTFGVNHTDTTLPKVLSQIFNCFRIFLLNRFIQSRSSFLTKMVQGAYPEGDCVLQLPSFRYNFLFWNGFKAAPQSLFLLISMLNYENYEVNDESRNKLQIFRNILATMGYPELNSLCNNGCFEKSLQVTVVSYGGLYFFSLQNFVCLKRCSKLNF